MKRLEQGFEREEWLETVPEVPIPDEKFASGRNGIKPWQNMKSWMKPNAERSVSGLCGDRDTDMQLLLGVVGAPLIPHPVASDDQFGNSNIKDHPIEVSTAKYIVQQYIAATGGERALNSINSMYAVGKVRMAASEIGTAEGPGTGKGGKVKNTIKNGETGGFVLWQKRPDLWCLELVVSGCKISAGSDGKVAWRQTPWHHSHASRGPPRPLRRFFQGLDPKLTANLFSNSICTTEKKINDDCCFALKLEADSSSLRARSTSNIEIMRHTVWGYFSQRTGLLVKIEDSSLIRIEATGNESVFWETTMETMIEDYRFIDGINIAHSGTTTASLFRFGENEESHSKTKMEEICEIEEVDFNIVGLSIDCFLPPSDLTKMEEHGGNGGGGCANPKLPLKIRSASSRISSSKVVAIEVEDGTTPVRGL